MFGFLGEKLILSITLSLSISYSVYEKKHLKKKAKGLHNSIYPFIFAPRLRDNASEKEGSLGEWLKPPVC